MNKEDLLENLNKYKNVLIPIVVVILLAILSPTLSSYTGYTPFWTFVTSIGILFTLIVLINFIQFYTSEARLEQTFNQFHASHFLSSFYKIFFPVIILSIIIQVLFSFALLPEELGGWGVLDQPKISPSGMMTFVIQGLVVGLGIIAFADYEMKNNNLQYSKRGSKMNIFKSFVYILPLLGLFFGITYLLRFLLQQIYGTGILIPSQSNAYEIDSGLIRASRFWTFLTDTEKNMVLIGFLIVYLSLEVLLRGLISREAEGYQLGPAGIVLVPAILQATAFSNGLFVFSEPVYYFYTLVKIFLFGFSMGIILWRTGNFGSVILGAFLVRLLDANHAFQRVVLSQLPEFFGEYDPFDNVTTTADTLGVYFVYVQIAIVVISPFILLVGYEEVLHILKSLYNGFKNQWFGYLIFGFAFFLIDLVFSFFSTSEIFGPLIGFFIALFVIGFILQVLFKVLPEPVEPPVLHSSQDMFGGELPLNVVNDIEFLERDKRWYEYPRRIGVGGAFAFIYFLFLSATYRQYTNLTFFEGVKFTVFLVILPTALLGISGYLFSRAITKGFFFSESWRSTFYIVIAFNLFLNILIWTSASATVNFHWRNVVFFVAFSLLIWSKPIETPTKDLAIGLARDGRYATFKWIEDNPEYIEKEFENLKTLPSDNIQVGSYILAAKTNLLTGEDLIQSLREEDLERGETIGALMSLGILNHEDSEGVLLKYLENEDVDIKIAAYWSLGILGTKKSLRKMAKILEENPKKELVPIAEKSILRIDPMYPLAGVRDSIRIDT